MLQEMFNRLSIKGIVRIPIQGIANHWDIKYEEIFFKKSNCECPQRSNN